MYTIGEFATLIGVSSVTLRNWDRNGKLKPDRLPSGQRRYTEDHLRQVRGIKSNRINVIYSRESTRQQESSLHRQEQQLKDFCQAHGLTVDRSITDFGSGLNYKRKGLLELVQLLCTKSVGTLVIAHKDRLVRFGFDMFAELCKMQQTELVIMDKTEEEKSKQEEFAEDLIAIVHYFSMRLYGSRSYKKHLVSDSEEAVE